MGGKHDVIYTELEIYYDVHPKINKWKTKKKEKEYKITNANLGTNVNIYLFILAFGCKS